MTNKHLHIVCLDVPYPPDYGGVFDLFYKIKSLHETGVRIHLHCFDYGRGKQDQLNIYCESVSYYKRKKKFITSAWRLPYIVSSRANRRLLNNILKDDFPVLLEGIHCTYFLYTGDLKNKKVFVRLHNVEHEYYKQLEKATNNLFKKLYYKTESFLLKRYERAISKKATIIAVSEKDKKIFTEKFAVNNIHYLPVFVPYQENSSKPGSGNFCLYQGNLSVDENEKAVLWLIATVFNDIDIPFVIAGKNPSRFLKKTIHGNENFCIIENPSNNEMYDLSEKAHIHVLPSFNTTGVKIKLLNALFIGRFIITNNNAVEDSKVASLCHIAESADNYKKMIKHLYGKQFTKGDIDKRKEILETLYNNNANAQKLIKLIW